MGSAAVGCSFEATRTPSLTSPGAMTARTHVFNTLRFLYLLTTNKGFCDGLSLVLLLLPFLVSPMQLQQSQPAAGGQKQQQQQQHSLCVGCMYGRSLRRLYTASADESLALWDVETGERIKKMKGHLSVVNAISVFGARTLSPVPVYGHAAAAAAAAGAGPGAAAAAAPSAAPALLDGPGGEGDSNRNSNSSSNSNSNSSSKSYLFSTGNNSYSTKFLIASGGDDGTSRVWDLRTRKCVLKAQHHYQVSAKPSQFKDCCSNSSPWGPRGPLFDPSALAALPERCHYIENDRWVALSLGTSCLTLKDWGLVCMHADSVRGFGWRGLPCIRWFTGQHNSSTWEFSDQR